MQDAFNKIKANDGFIVTQANYLTDFDREVITYLYQPLMGASAYSLLMLLWTEAAKQPMLANRKTHSYLFTLLGEDLPTFYDDRIRLEALGLIRTYHGEDKIGNYFVFELYAPLTPEKFFNEDLLSLFLYETVGERRLAELKDHFKLYPVRKAELTEVTKDFLSVFHINPESLDQVPQSVVTTRMAFPNQKSSKPDFSIQQVESFDWSFLADYVNRYHITVKDINDHKHQIFSLVSFYGIEPIALGNLLGKTRNLIDDRINMENLERTIRTSVDKKSSVRVHQNEVPASILTKQNESDLITLGFTKNEISLINKGSTLSPSEFLYEIRGGGIVGSNEISTVKMISDRNEFNDTVLKIFIVASTLGRDSRTIIKSISSSLFNAWHNLKVKTADDAINAMKKRLEKPTYNQKYQRKDPIRKEKLPEWAKKGYKATAKEPTAEEKRIIEAELKKLKSSGDGGKS